MSKAYANVQIQLARNEKMVIIYKEIIHELLNNYICDYTRTIIYQIEISPFVFLWLKFLNKLQF